MSDLDSDLVRQIRGLTTEFAAEFQTGRRYNIAAYAKRIAAEGRSQLLTELFAIRCANLDQDETSRIAVQWKMAFPDFKGIGAPRLPALAETPPSPLPEAKETGSVDSPVKPHEQSLELGIHRQIDAACLQFEAALRDGNRPDVSAILDRVDVVGRQQLLVELLQLAVEYRGRPGQQNLEQPGPVARPMTAVELEQTIIGVLQAGVECEPSPVKAPVPAEQETKNYVPPAIHEVSTVIGIPVAVVPPTRNPYPSLPDYQILDELGRGGMGIVYKARQISLQRLVALKMVLRAEFASQEELVRFRQEAESAAQLDHPGIVPVFEVGESDGRHYFSMAYVEGKSLGQRLQQGPLGLKEAAELVRQLAVAVAYAHVKGIVHRDLKPGNVLLDRSGRPRITDFGLAKRTDLGNELTMTGQIVGTPSYMPPEQARGQITEIGPHSDIYSLGAVLYACLTGRPPFQAANPIETLQQVQQNEPASLRLLNKEIPRDLEIICLKCLAKKPADRYATAAHLALDLARWQRGEPIEARPISRLRRAIMWCRRHRSLSGAVVTAGVALLVLGIVQLRANYLEADRKRVLGEKQRELDAERERVASQRRLSQLAYADQQRAEGAAMALSGGDMCQGMFRLATALRICHDLKDAKREETLRNDLLVMSRSEAVKKLSQTPKSLPPPDDPAKVFDWIEWITGRTWDPAQPRSTPLAEQRMTTLEKQFQTKSAPENP